MSDIDSAGDNPTREIRLSMSAENIQLPADSRGNEQDEDDDD